MSTPLVEIWTRFNEATRRWDVHFRADGGKTSTIGGVESERNAEAIADSLLSFSEGCRLRLEYDHGVRRSATSKDEP